MIKKDLVHIVGEDEWYEAARSRTVWRSMCVAGVEDEVMYYVHRPPVNQHILCKLCNRTFSRESNKNRHKCVAEKTSYCAKKEQCSVPDVLNGLRAKEGRTSIHVYQEMDIFALYRAGVTV